MQADLGPNGGSGPTERPTEWTMLDDPAQGPEQDSGQADDYEIVIRHCNSIDEARISLRRSSLNIKYGPNGLGKSTIARALSLNAASDGTLDELTPFKCRSDPTSPRPALEGADAIRSVLTFNDNYVSQFAFQRDEVLRDSFEIFINTEEYRKGLEDIESLFETLKQTFVEQTEFNEALTSFTELRDAFNITRGGAVAKNSRGYKALGMAAKLTNIPEQLQGFTGFLHSDDPAGWISWQSKGKSFLDLSENCPFCSSPSVDKQTIAQVSTEYESSAVKNMSVLRSTIDKLGRYFEPQYLNQLEELTTSIVDISPEQDQFLATLRGQVETLLQKLAALRSISFHSLREAEDVSTVLAGLEIDLTLLHAFNSDATRSVVDLINHSLQEVATEIGEIKRRVGQQKARVAGLIRSNQNSINDFLRSAGYRYTVRIDALNNSYRMLLEHVDASGHIESASSHLSYGEKNAFALVLFMHHVRRENPDLVILDDPVSSFDKTKKFAILHRLFRGPDSLRDVTSLLLTHDIEPAIDVVLTGASRHFIAADPAVHFLSSRGGMVTEKPIHASDIRTFSQVCDANIDTATDPIIKCIYLRRRFEVHGSVSLGYDLLSSLLHLRTVPTRRGDGGHVELNGAEQQQAAEEVREFIPDFDYTAYLDDLTRPGALRERFEATEVGYEKVQLFRILLELDPVGLKGDDVFAKFVNETYHIENEYVMQLNPRDFETVPEFVVSACATLVKDAPTIP